jgi:type IV pilus assembly protein PilW
MAGNFGCFNMSNSPASAVIEDKSSDEYTLKTANNLLPIKEIELSYPGFTQKGKALLFQYGIDKADAAAKTAIVSSCSRIAKPQTKIKDLNKIIGNGISCSLCSLRQVYRQRRQSFHVS